ncbi:odorant receptor 13a-like isoform X6 [Solenopsis invicta]|uniref:odorant receptor 13a-like isoform X6 n=1 Tax=Solenopsis invicta TaxID=13686 RepID=UPI00193D5BC3|nr:odorant receptor 13a-like isoform X6 [Solenopsis invicta]
METPNHCYYGVVKKVLSLAGQWPYQKQKTKLICLSIVTLSIFSLFIPQIARLVECHGDLQCIFQTMAAYMLTTVALVKLYTCNLNQCKWDELETPEECEIMRRYAETSRRYALRYSSWEIAVIGIVAHDCILLTYIEHLCSIFTLVGFRFERLMRDNATKTLHSNASDVYRKRIAFFVYTHRKALKFAQLIEDTFSLTLGIQIILNTAMISITLLQITQQNAHVLVVLRYVFYVLSQLIHLFCLSFEGQKLIDHSLQTRDKIYNSLWYETSPKLQKMLLFIMQKTLQPIFFSACKIYIFSLENFTTVVQTSMSYFTVLETLE